MIRHIYILSAIIQLLTLPAVVAQPNDSMTVNPSGPLALSGFVDVRGVYSNEADKSSKFSIGQAELDLEHKMSSRVGVFLAAAYNSENGAMELGAAELQLTLRDDSRHFLNSINLVAGQFDVPFGIGCRYYASPDCETVTSPWYSHRIGNWSGWNDYGVRIEAISLFGTADLFVVNGYEESQEIVHRVINLATGFEEESLEVISTSPEVAIGGRLGAIPLNELVEIGFSASLGINDNGNVDMTLLGSDLTVDRHQFGCRSEFVYSSLDRNGQREICRSYYVQAHYHISSWRVISRFAAVNEWRSSWASQYSAGLALPVAPGTEVRCEIIRTSQGKLVGMLQIVAGF